jgi:hypothetical protein
LISGWFKIWRRFVPKASRAATKSDEVLITPGRLRSKPSITHPWNVLETTVEEEVPHGCEDALAQSTRGGNHDRKQLDRMRHVSTNSL